MFSPPRHSITAKTSKYNPINDHFWHDYQWKSSIEGSNHRLPTKQAHVLKC
jgi:hypothetical protein